MRGLIIDGAILLAVAIVLTALGPFGSYQLGGFADRFAYWLPATLIGYAIFRPTAVAILWLARRMGFNRWAALIAVILIAAFPATLGIAMLSGRTWSTLPDATSLFPLYVNVALIGALILGLFLMLQPEPAPVTSVEPSPSEVRSPFIDRLSPGFAHPLVALEMEDHYLRAHGQGGQSELILMRMRDALAELGVHEGKQVHRSWWVAKSAIVGRRRVGRNLVLDLGNGLEVPVARDRVATLKAAGWL